MPHGFQVAKQQVRIPSLEALGGELEDAPTGDSIVLLGDFNANEGSNSIIWVSMGGMAFLI